MSFAGLYSAPRTAITKFVFGVVINMRTTGRRWRGGRKSPHHHRRSQAGRPKPSTWIPRARRLSIRKPIFYRQLDHSQFHLGMLQNISESGVLLECHPLLPEGAKLEMIFEMPQEITGQRNRRVLCRGEVVRSAFAKSAIPLVGVAISGYRFLLQS